MVTGGTGVTGGIVFAFFCTHMMALLHLYALQTVLSGSFLVILILAHGAYALIPEMTYGGCGVVVGFGAGGVTWTVAGAFRGGC